MLVAAVVMLEAGPIGPGTNELVYCIATIAILVLLVAALGLAVLLAVRHHRQREARLSMVEQQLTALDTDRDRGGP